MFENWQPSPVSAMLHGKPCEEFQKSNIELGGPFFVQIMLNSNGFFALDLMIDPAIQILGSVDWSKSRLL